MMTKIKVSGLAMLFAVLLLVCANPADAKAQQGNEDAYQKLDRIAGILQQRLNSVDADLSSAAAALAESGLAGPKATSILAGLCSKHAPSVDCVTIDASGIIRAVAPASYRRTIGADVSSQAQVARLRSTKKPVLSEPFKAVEGVYVIDFEWPILSKNGDLIGSVSLIGRPLPYIDAIIKPELSSDTSDVWILQTNGKIIYSRYRQDIGDNPLATPSYVTGATLDSLVKQIIATPSGTGQFTSPPIGKTDVAYTSCYWKTIKFNDVPWRVVLFGPIERE